VKHQVGIFRLLHPSKFVANIHPAGGVEGTPVPLRASISGVVGELLTILNEPFDVISAVGENVTVNWQLPAGCTVVPTQFPFEPTANGSAVAKEVILRPPEPVLLIVTVKGCVLARPTIPKAAGFGLNPTIGAMPVPDNGTITVPPDELEKMLSCAE
jgi:hypothetical protein